MADKQLNGSIESEVHKESPVDQKKLKKQIKISITFLPKKTLQQLIPIAEGLYKNFADNSVPKETLASLLKLSAKSSNIPIYISSAEAYGIILKDGENYKLTELGRKLVAPTFTGEDKEAAKKAILTPTLLSRFYNDYNNHPIPKSEFLPNILEQNYDLPRDRVEEAIDVILSNAAFANLIHLDKDTSTQYIVINNATKNMDVVNKEEESNLLIKDEVKARSKPQTEFEKVCFIISPIGDETSEFRKHANMILKHLIQPVAEQFSLKIVRADSIDKSGLITQQILEHLVNAPFCIADLSFNNPNVFYELGVRHMSQLPTIQIIRKGDKIPFDVSQGRTITVDLTDIYTVMDRIESAKRELNDHLTAILKAPANDIPEDNPIKVYLPNVKINIIKNSTN